jgi:hypothetical protein
MSALTRFRLVSQFSVLAAQAGAAVSNAIATHKVARTRPAPPSPQRAPPRRAHFNANCNATPGASDFAPNRRWIKFVMLA